MKLEDQIKFKLKKEDMVNQALVRAAVLEFVANGMGELPDDPAELIDYSHTLEYYIQHGFYLEKEENDTTESANNS